MDKPLLSIVIPVKNNTGTLEFTVDTVLKQSYSNIEIVISNNSRQENLKHLVEKFNDSRIKYICPDKTMNFSGDWNFSLTGATGDYVTFLGDDDAALPVSYEIGMKYLIKNSQCVFTWKKLNYNWTNHIIPEKRNYISGDFNNEIFILDSNKSLNKFCKFLIGYNQLPCIYNSIVPIEIINKVKSKTKSGKFFGGIIPDVYSSFAVASEINNYYYYNSPITINGASDKSSGVLQGLKSLNSEQKKLIPDAINSGNKYHPDIGPFSSSIASIALGEYLLAKENINGFKGTQPVWFLYVLYLIREAKYSENPDKILAAARYTRNRKKIPLVVPSKVKSRKPNLVTNFKGNLKLNPELINDVQALSLLLSYVNTDEIKLNNQSFSRVFISTMNFFKMKLINYIKFMQ